MTTFNRRTMLVGAAAATLGAPTLVRAQGAADWPKGALRIIVPFPPGGSTDPVARIIQAKMIENTGWNILVDNKPGGTGAIAEPTAPVPPAASVTLPRDLSPWGMFMAADIVVKAVMIVLANLAADLVYGKLDPRVVYK